MSEERLETGWDPQTPWDDTIVRRYAVGSSDWMESVARATGDRVLRTDDFVAVDERSPERHLNAVFVLRPFTDAEAAGVAARWRDFYSGDGGGFIVFSPWPLPAMEGVTVAGHPPLMLRPPGGSAPPLPPELEVVDVTDVQGLREYEDVLVHGFPLESLQPLVPGSALHEPMLSVEGWRMWVGRVDGRPVCAAAAGTSHGLVRVEWVATAPDARRRGYGAAVTWAATTAVPTLPAILLATDDGRPVYERLGYLPVTRFTCLVGERHREAASGDTGDVIGADVRASVSERNVLGARA